MLALISCCSPLSSKRHAVSKEFKEFKKFKKFKEFKEFKKFKEFKEFKKFKVQSSKSMNMTSTLNLENHIK